MIINTKNKKMYIGQTTDYRKRASNYRTCHKHPGKNKIYRIIANEGTENFQMKILQTCSPRALTELEDYYIERYKTNDPKYGYNSIIGNGYNNTDKSRLAKSEAHKGLVESNETKCKKSNTILAIKGDHVIICDSAKLFGDYVGRGKDQIKNCLRQPSSIHGYRLYYRNFKKRQEIRSRMIRKRSIRDRQYMEILDFLDKLEIEGVETIDLYYDVYFLKYGNVINAKPFIVDMKGSRCYFEG